VAESTRKRSTRTASKLKPEATDAEDALYDATIPMSALDEPMMFAKETSMQAPIAETSFLSPRKALGDVTNSGLEVSAQDVYLEHYCMYECIVFTLNAVCD
jgi:hypothetical protein